MKQVSKRLARWNILGAFQTAPPVVREEFAALFFNHLLVTNGEAIRTAKTALEFTLEDLARKALSEVGK